MITTEQIVRNELASVKAEGYVFSDTDLELVDKVVSGEMSIEEAVKFLKEGVKNAIKSNVFEQ